MNVITKALTDLRYKIPYEILELAFKRNNITTSGFNYSNLRNSSLDGIIRSIVINPRVLVDCNIYGGVTVEILLEQCKITRMTTNQMLIEVPKELTSNREIVKVSSVVMMPYTMQSAPLLIGREGGNIASKMYHSVADESNIINSADIELIGSNLLLVGDSNVFMGYGVIRATIENDTELGNLSIAYSKHISSLVELAVKSYIYNSLKIKLDKGYVSQGHELGSVVEIVDSYSTAEEEYVDKLLKTTAIFSMSQKTVSNRLISLAVGIGY